MPTQGSSVENDDPVFDRSNRLATLADQYNPTSKTKVCSSGLNQDTSGDQPEEEILNKFQPQPSGSESADKT